MIYIMSEKRQYYYERQGKEMKQIDLNVLNKYINILYEKYKNIHYFQAAFGKDCVDAGYIKGWVGVSMERDIFLQFPELNIYPIEVNYKNFDELSCFTVIEYLFDNISKPTDTYYHSWDDCGIHINKHDKAQGQKEFAEKINGILKLYKEGEYKLYSDRKIRTVPGNREVIEPLEMENRGTLSYESFKIQISRGGDWKIEGVQSFFQFKVKVKNPLKTVITNVQILMGETPPGLQLKSEKLFEVPTLQPSTFVGPSFDYLATDNCVGSYLKGIIRYDDYKGENHTFYFELFEIQYTCNLLTPEQISKSDFEKKTIRMEDKKLSFNCDIQFEDLETWIKNVLEANNFFILKQIQEIQSDTLKVIDGFARGKYDQQEVAITIIMQKMEEETELIIKTMSEDKNKLIDVLKDINVKCEDIKTDTEFIKEYSIQIEDLFNNFENKLEDLEIYLKKRLASDWEKIKATWKEFKSGEINKGELIKRGLKAIGKKFLKKVFQISFSTLEDSILDEIKTNL